MKSRMDQSYPAYQMEQRKTDWINTLQLAFSLAVFICATLIALVVFFGRLSLSQNNLMRELGVSAGAMLSVFAWSAVMVAVTAIVSVISSARKMAGKVMPGWTQAKMLWLYGAIAILPVFFVVGQNLFKVAKHANTWMPIFSVVSIFIAGTWYMRIGIGRDWGKRLQRNSGLLTFSFGFTTWLVLISEIVVLAVFGMVFFLATRQDPQMQDLFQNLPNLLQGFQGDLQAAEAIIAELMQKPVVIFSAILIIAFLMPLVEELLKPLGVLLLKGRNISPREGMQAGIISGAGFGILEGMLFGIQTGPGIEPEAWIIFVIGRAAALILHIFNGALNGFALVRFWENRKAGHLVGTFLITLLIHGVWNLTAILASANFLDQTISLGITISIFVLVFINFVVFTRKDGNPNQEIAFNNGL